MRIQAVARVDHGGHWEAGLSYKLGQGFAPFLLIFERPLLTAVDVEEEVFQEQCVVLASQLAPILFCCGLIVLFRGADDLRFECCLGKIDVVAGVAQVL